MKKNQERVETLAMLRVTICLFAYGHRHRQISANQKSIRKMSYHLMRIYEIHKHKT